MSGCSHVGAIIFVPDVLNHANAHHSIESLGDFPVIAELNFYVQSATPTLRVTELFPRNCYPDYVTTIVRGGVASQSTPTAANVQQTQTGSQTQPFANPIELAELRRG